MKVIHSHWNSASKTLFTEYKGELDVEDVREWTESLQTALSKIPPGTLFKFLVDLSGFNPIDIKAHKAMRNIVPEILASHGMRPAFIDLFDEKPEMKITINNGITCRAFANVHHDKYKMEDYQKRIGRADQQFFTDLESAREWLIRV